MKYRIIMFLIIFILFSNLMFSIGSNSNEEQKIVVYNVNDLLSSIGSNKTIQIKAGDYIVSGIDLSKINNPNVKMHEWSGLMISDVKNLKLVGEKGVRILSEDIYLDVLSFKNVQDLQISNVIAGHLSEVSGCAGGVFRFEDSKNITVANCDLFGCGAEGLYLWNVDTFNFVNSIIRDCSLRIMTINNSKNVIIKNSLLKNCQPYELIYLYQSDNVKFISCEIIENESENYIFYNEESTNIALSKCKIVRNKSQFFGNYDGCVDIDSETTINPAQFSISMYGINEDYDNYEGYKNYDEIEEYDSNWDSGLKTETVKTTSELYNAIGSNKIIKIKKGTYNFKNQTLKFGGVSNLKIIGENGVTIGIEDPYEMVISFFDSKNITIQNITAGHFVEKGACGGGVISFECCKNVTVDKCDLFGSGTEGLIVINGNGIIITNSIIRECIYSFMYIDNAKNIVFSNTRFNNNETYYDLVYIIGSNAIFDKCTISNNIITTESNYAMFNITSSNVVLNDSLIKNNAADYFEKIKGSVIIQGKTKFEGNNFRKGMYEKE